MENKMKKVLVALSMVLLGLSLSACNKKADEGTTDTTAQEQPAAEEAQPAAEEAQPAAEEAKPAAEAQPAAEEAKPAAEAQPAADAKTAE